MPSSTNPLPDELGEHFTVANGHRTGLSRQRMRASDLKSPHRGVRSRLPSAPDSDDSPLALSRRIQAETKRRALSYSEVMPAHSFFCGRTAAVCYGAPIDLSENLEVAVIAPARAPRARGIRGLSVAAHLASVRDVDGIALASPATTWAMLGAELSVRELVIVGDHFVRVPRDNRGRLMPSAQLATTTQLRAAIAAGRRRGTPRLREAVELIRVGSSSPLETEHRLDSETAGLPRPELDVEIRDQSGRLLGISEIVYRSHRVVVEIEGDHHRTSRRQWNRDLDKYAAYAAEDWEIVRLTSAHIRGPNPRAVQLVRAALTRRGWRV